MNKMIPKRFRSDLLRDFSYGMDIFNDFFGDTTFTFMRGDLYNPETHDLVPKQSYKKKQLELKENRLKELKTQRESDNRTYDELEKNLKLEIDQLKQEVNN